MTRERTPPGKPQARPNADTQPAPTLSAADYRPPRWLRNAHLQSALASSPQRRHRGQRLLASSGAVTRAHILDAGEGIRLQGLHSTLPGTRPRGLALLLHGWEGSTESSYMRLTAAQLLARGFEVFRLNFRDHGQTHHLNEELFHSNRIDEVVHAVGDLVRRFPGNGAQPRPLYVAGYSLGGNFALRLGLRAPAAGLDVAHVAAVCPVLDPAATMDTMERGLPLYQWYFQRKWRQSLLRKRALFPHRLKADDRTLAMKLRPLTQWLVERHTDFGSIERYFDGYSIAGDRLTALAVPASILTSRDDPVIPVAGFHALQLATGTQLEITEFGGHCGFIENTRLHGFGERWVAERLAASAAD